jgi:cytochrome c5
VNKLIQRILSKKRNVAILVILLIAIVGAASYTISGIQENVTAMSEPVDAVDYFPSYPPLNPTASNANEIKRGEYIAKAGDCIACHTNTPEKGRAFAGGLPMPTPFGIIYSPNITPDKETGIGNWTEEQFEKAMRHGISPDGNYYYPAFPYIYFNRITPDDLKALKTYLDSIPAVKQVNRKNEMVWPFNQRLLQLPWRLMFFHPDQNQDSTLGSVGDAPQTEQLKRGAYLVEGLGHCAMCHSPSYKIFTDKLPLGAPIRKYALTGAKVQNYLAPDISKKNLATVPVEEILDVFLKDKLIGGGNIEGPMLEVNHDSLRYLTRSDLEAIAIYLKSVQSKAPPKPTGNQGKVIYESYCVGCHASGGGGAPKYGDASNWAPLMKNGIEQVYTHAIQGIGGMPAKGTCISCSNEDIKQAVNYMVAAVTGPGGKLMTPVPKPKPLTLEDGQRIYDKNCSVCHATGFKGAPKPGDKAVWKPIISNGFVETYMNVETGRKGHPPRGACMECTDDELIAAVKYMMQQSATDKNYKLW